MPVELPDDSLFFLYGETRQAFYNLCMLDLWAGGFFDILDGHQLGLLAVSAREGMVTQPGRARTLLDVGISGNHGVGWRMEEDGLSAWERQGRGSITEISGAGRRGREGNGVYMG
jgi:hypothetical protein